MKTYLSDRPFVRPVPFGDGVFVRFVERSLGALEAKGAYSPEDLEESVRVAFPHAAVRRTELNAPHEQAWYVYREGRWVPPRDAMWWLDDALPKLELDAAGFVWRANDAAEQFLCGAACQLVGRHFTDFTVTDPIAAVAEIGEAYRLDGMCEAAGEVRTLTGRVFVAEYFLESRSDGGACITLRLLPGLTPVVPHASAASFRRIICEPESDALFERYVQVVVGRMPEPHAAGIELRLRRLYPLATVRDAADGLVCRRDDWPDLGDSWWEVPGLPRLAFDRQSLIHECSPELRHALPMDPVGRFWQELTQGQGPDEAEATEVLFQIGRTETVVALATQAGPTYLHAHLEVRGELAEATLRPVDAAYAPDASDAAEVDG